MEQVSFDDLYGTDEFLYKEKAAFLRIKPALEDVLRNDNLAPNSIFFREGHAEKALYSSVYLFNEGSIFCRISFRGKQNYISISTKHKKLILEELKCSFDLSDSGYYRIELNEVDDILKYKSLLCKVLNAQIDSLPASFGCCSRYEACSDEKKCIHPDTNMAIKCAYRKNLKKEEFSTGRIKIYERGAIVWIK